MRTRGSPEPCANFRGAAKVSVEPAAETIVAVSTFDALPIETTSPVTKPEVLGTWTVVAPIDAAADRLVVRLPGETAATGTTVHQ